MKRRICFPSRFVVAAVSVLLLGPMARAGTEKVLYSFTFSEGSGPNGGVIFDVAGNLYGTTIYGGSPACNGGCGVVFKLAPSPDGWAYSTVYAFTGRADGSHPSSPLIFDGAGNLYGTTYGAYGEGYGTAFKLTPSAERSWGFSLLHTFGGGKDGIEPDGSLALDRAGNLYGVTDSGGSNDAGIVFELTPTTGGAWKETVIHTFTGCQDGALPFGLALDAGGVLYGTAQLGGVDCNPFGHGVVFKLSVGSDGDWKETVLHRFTDGADGGDPLGVVLDSSGNVYGTAGVGGRRVYCTEGCGLVFQLTAGSDGSWTESVLHNFNGGNGLFPQTLLFGSGGDLEGTSGSGGLGSGLAFRLASDAGWAEAILYEFSGTTDGGAPTGPVVLDRAGNLYGTAADGGYGYGTVFEITP